LFLLIEHKPYNRRLFLR